MSHPKFGEKYTCFQCGTKFYDMNKPKALCPKCQADQRKAPKRAHAKAAKQAEVAPDFDNEEEDSPIEEEELDGFPIKDEDEESFNPDSDRLSIDEMPDQDY